MYVLYAVFGVPTCERGEGRHDEQRQAVQQMKSGPRSCWEDERLPQGKPVIPQVSVIRPSCTVVFTAVCYLINLFTLKICGFFQHAASDGDWRG